MTDFELNKQKCFAEKREMIKDNRNITDGEFENIKRMLLAMRNPESVPEFNTDWMPFTEKQVFEVRKIIEADDEYSRKMKKFYNWLTGYFLENK